jgi:hypothetical protein
LRNIKYQKQTLEIVTMGQAAKNAKAKLKEYEDNAKKAKEAWAAAGKKVLEEEAAVKKNELDWTKRTAYHALMATAKLGAEADKADKDFAKALTDSDKRAALAAKATIKKDLQDAEASSEKEQDKVAHMKFDIQAQKRARIERDAEEQAAMAAAAGLAAKQKAEQEEGKKAMEGVGKP